MPTTQTDPRRHPVPNSTRYPPGAGTAAHQPPSEPASDQNAGRTETDPPFAKTGARPYPGPVPDHEPNHATTATRRPNPPTNQPLRPPTQRPPKQPPPNRTSTSQPQPFKSGTGPSRHLCISPVASLPPSASEAVGAAVAQNATTHPTTHRRHPNRRSRQAAAAGKPPQPHRVAATAPAGNAAPRPTTPNQPQARCASRRPAPSPHPSVAGHRRAGTDATSRSYHHDGQLNPRPYGGSPVRSRR